MSQLESVLNQIVSRLENVAARLEKVEKTVGTGGAASHATAPAASHAGAGDEDHPFVVAYDALVADHISKVVEASKAIGSELPEMMTHLNKALAEHRKLLVTASKSKKPSDADFQKLVGGMIAAATEIGKLKDKSRTSKVFNHLSAIADGIGALNWVAVTPTPAPFIGDMIGGAEFYTNRILKDFKGKDETQVSWAQGWSTFLRELQKYVKANHTTGLSWKANGGDAVANFNAAGAGAAPAAPAAPPAPPAAPAPPPAPAPGAASHSDKADPAAAASAVFAQLNSGNVTAGLKKVTDDMKVYKNPALKAQGPVVEKTPVAAPKPAAKATAAKKGPAKTALEGNKWVVENHDGGEHVIDATENKQTVYVYKCDKAMIKINGKINAITIDGCKSVIVVFGDAIATCEVVNTSGFKIQYNKVPAITIDKCSNGQLYVSANGMDTDIITSKSDAINVVLPAKKEGDDPVEANIPEQFLTKIKDYQLHTESVKHTGV